jgi:hypothetical protein
MKAPSIPPLVGGTICFVLSIWILAGCSSPQLPEGAVGNAGHYNYSPSVIESGNTRKFWWCSEGVNPVTSKRIDAIYYESLNTYTFQTTGPMMVLIESPSGWDSVYVCNPKVVGGVFVNPLGDGQTYTYAMYYVGTGNTNGASNSIGVAFSQDGIHWNKYPQPVIASTSQTGYGVGQPAAYNTDQKSAVTVFYEDNTPTLHHVEATSNDGLHFKVQGTLTTVGLADDDPDPSWGDMAYDSKTGEWYALFNRPLRPPSTTGGVVERGQYGIVLYKIPNSALLTGATPWQQLNNMDTNATGFESNFIAGFVRSPYGGLDVASYPTIQMYTSISYPPPAWNATPAQAADSAGTGTWILMPMTWVPDNGATRPFTQYFNGIVHEATTGWISQGFETQHLLGHLYANPPFGASVAFYGCDVGQGDYVVSLDSSCQGKRILGVQGYGYSRPVPGLDLVEIYRCSTPQDHFVSRDSNCNGQTVDQLLGYILP